MTPGTGASAVLDTSVVVDLGDPTVGLLVPIRAAISAITLAELATGPHLAVDPVERARRQAHLQRIETLFEVLDFDVAAAQSYGLLVAAAGRSHRSRQLDLMIAAVAHARNLPLYTRNPNDLVGLDAVLDVQAI